MSEATPDKYSDLSAEDRSGLIFAAQQFGGTSDLAEYIGDFITLKEFCNRLKKRMKELEEYQKQEIRISGSSMNLLSSGDL